MSATTGILAPTGFVYVATGERYRREAAASAATLRQHHPTARICLITDEAPAERFWDDLVLLENAVRGFRDKLEMRRVPYARAVFLDTDTRVCGDLSPLFTILERYAFCGVQLSEGQDYVMSDGIPAAFPEMNSGVLGFQTGAATAELFARWGESYDALRAADPAHYAAIGDQKSLRAALWHSQVRHAAIGAEFNFIPFRVELTSLPVAVIHTRAKTDRDPLIQRLNARLGRRTYIPVLDVIVSDNMSTAELRRLVLAGCRQLARRAARRLLPRAWRDRLHASPRLRSWFLGNRYCP